MFNENLLFRTNDYGISKSSLMLLATNKNFLNRKIKKHGNLQTYLRYLIRSYGTNLKNDIPLEFRITKKYQAHGLKYTRVKFEIEGNTWMAYQLLAFYHRFSISYLFALLLRWDSKKNDFIKNFHTNSIVTGFSKKIYLKIELFTNQILEYDYKCILKMKI